MSYVKYREDDIKIVDNRLYMSGRTQIRPTKPAVRYYDCKYCHILFTSKAALFKHIQVVHNIVRPLIVINDKVVADYTVLQYVQNAKIILYGYENTIRLDGKLLPQEDSDEIDITELLKSVLNKQKHCRIDFENASVNIKLHPIQIDSNSKIKTTIDDWQESILMGKPLNSSHLSDFKDSELVFIQGVYNYFLGCTAAHYKAKRYDDAFALLSQFHDLNGIGRCILKAIAFRRNWVDSLRLLTGDESDVFSTANEYFSGQASSFEYEEDNALEHLYVEEGTKTSLELITLYQKGLYSEAKAKLLTLGDIDDLDDLNLVEQLYLLKARIAAIEHKPDEAFGCYKKLITPAFCEEFRIFKLNHNWVKR